MTQVAKKKPVNEKIRSLVVGVIGGKDKIGLMSDDIFDLVPIDSTLDRDLSRNAFDVVVAFAEADEAAAFIPHTRRLIGDETYFALLLPEGVPNDTVIALVELGADYVFSASLDESLKLLRIKAQRAVRLRQEYRRRLYEVQAGLNEIHTAINYLPSPVFFKNKAGVYTGCNRAFEQHLGRSAGDIVGSTVFDVCAPELARSYHEADEALMREGGEQHYEKQLYDADGNERYMSFHKAAIHHPVTGEVSGVVGAMLDITERKELEEKLRKAAERDYLTGVYNRRKFFKLAREWIKIKGHDQGLAVLVLDVDHFKKVNDSFGHACGDTALCHLVRCCEAILGQDHVLARAGGEEFFVLLKDCDLELATDIAERLRQAIAEIRFEFSGRMLEVKVSIGCCVVENGLTVDQALARADKALYKSKEKGRNQVSVYQGS